MTVRKYVCVQCSGKTCLQCGGLGWLGEPLVRLERTNKLKESVAKILVQKKIAEIGQDEWAKLAAKENVTVAQFTEVETWMATGPISYQFMSLDVEVSDALCQLAGIEIPPILVSEQPDLKVLRFDAPEEDSDR